jgi:hypothetical protein
VLKMGMINYYIDKDPDSAKKIQDESKLY